MYALSDLVLITGLTERTLRTHLKRGILKGQKEGRADTVQEILDEYKAL